MGLVRFDGLYVRESRRDSLWWLRFFDGGAVLDVGTSPGPPAQIASWLRPGHPQISTGEWALHEGRLSLAATSRYGTVRYEGEARGDALSLAWHSDINDQRGEGTWRFCPLDARALDGPTSPSDFRPIRAYSALARAGLDARAISAIRRAKSLTLTNINYATPEEIAAWAGVDLADARRVCAWRDGG
ncbi:MAG: hypothetical protein R3A52_04510 [Polyangiales bacterium]